MSLMGAVHRREFDRITNEEDRLEKTISQISKQKKRTVSKGIDGVAPYC